MSSDMDYQVPVPEDVKAKLNEVGRSIGSSLPEGWGFALFIFTFGPGGTMTWISNAKREDMLRALKEFQDAVGRGGLN